MGNLVNMLNAKTVALVGATEKEGVVGRTIMENLLRSKGARIYPVNPKRTAVMGITAYPDIGDIPEHVDLAVIATPAHTVPQIVEACGKAGVDGAAIISAGFGEAGKEGVMLEADLEIIRKRYGMRVLGPNCLGFARTGIGLNATFLKADLPSGNIAFLSQSGALGRAIVDWAVKAGAGFSMIATFGSMIDIDFGDLIDFLGDDPETKSILIYMEGVRNARKFMSAARAFALHKPIIVLKPGRSTEGAVAARFHTGIRAGDDAVYDAAFRRAGVVRVREIGDLFNAASVLDSGQLPMGDRLAVVTDAGGPGVMATDALVDLGGQLAKLTPESIRKIDTFLPPYWSKTNPVDVGGDADIDRYLRSIKTCLEDPMVDGLLVIYVPQAAAPGDKLAAEIVLLAKTNRKPVIAVWMGSHEVETGRNILIQNNIPTYETPEQAVRTYLTMYKYRRNLNHLYETPAELPVQEPSDKEQLKAAIRDKLLTSRTLLDADECQNLLVEYGISVTIGTPENVDCELMVRSRKDKEFGSVIFFEMGGREADLVKDVSIGLPPLNQTLAKMLMEETRVYRVLQGHERRESAVLVELEEILVGLSNLIIDFPRIAEIDIGLSIVGGRVYTHDPKIVIDRDYVEGKSRYPHLVIMPYPTRYIQTWKLPDGTNVLLRPIRPEDEPLHKEMLASVSSETLRMRFFSSIEVSHWRLLLLCNIDYDRHVAIIAEIAEDRNRKIIGAGRVVIDPDSKSGELAILVHDSYQGRGLGHRLVEMLIEIVRERGLEEIVGDVLTENTKMLEFAHEVGFSRQFLPDGVTRIALKL